MFIIKKIYNKGGWTVQQVSNTESEVQTSSLRDFSTKRLIKFLTDMKATHIERVNNLKNYKIEFWGKFDRLPQDINTSKLQNLILIKF